MFILSLVLTITGCPRKAIIKTDPTDATIYINEKLLGNSPIETNFVITNAYTIEVIKNGYIPFKKTITAGEKELCKTIAGCFCLGPFGCIGSGFYKPLPLVYSIDLKPNK